MHTCALVSLADDYLFLGHTFTSYHSCLQMTPGFVSGVIEAPKMWNTCLKITPDNCRPAAAQRLGRTFENTSCFCRHWGMMSERRDPVSPMQARISRAGVLDRCRVVSGAEVCLCFFMQMTRGRGLKVIYALKRKNMRLKITSGNCRPCCRGVFARPVEETSYFFRLRGRTSE